LRVTGVFHGVNGGKRPAMTRSFKRQEAVKYKYPYLDFPNN
jgi:hypothetical protein